MSARPKPEGASGPTPGRPRVTPAESHHPVLACALAWLVPGAGHFLLGRNRQALIFFAVLTFMYVFGLGLGGRLFPFAASEPLVFLSAVAQWSIGLARLASLFGGFGQGSVVSPAYEFGNTFLIVGGLLNTLIILDAYDLATGRKVPLRA
jgi:hypothetical protein